MTHSLKSKNTLLAATAAAAFFLTAAPLWSQTNVFVDPARTWIGFMNVFELPENGGNYDFGSAWGTADLNASFSGAILTFTPNTSIDRDAPNDPFWWNPDGSPNKIMDANFYVQNDTLAGQTITFSGYCWTNTLQAPYSNSVIAFIKDFVSDYSSSTSITTNLTGPFFSITLPTAGGDHIQYGFEMIGPDARLTNIANLGSVIVSSNTPPAGPLITSFPGNTSVMIGSNVSLAVSASGSSLVYQWKRNNTNLLNGPGISGANTSTLTLSNVVGDTEANYVLTVSNFTGTASATAHVTIINPSHLTMDPRAGWVGYMNVFDLAMAFQFGQPWGVADLRANFNSATLTLAPNTNVYNPSDPFWVNPDGSGAKNMDAIFYQQFDQLAGLTVTFTGYCPANTLTNGYTSSAFIRDFDPSFNLLASTNIPLTGKQAFSITMATTPGDHIQWGFETLGPDANPVTVAGLGNAMVSISPPTVAVTRSGNTAILTFPTETGLDYNVQYKTNLTDAVWQSLGTTNGNGGVRSWSDVSGSTRRFYRVSAQ